MAKKIKYNLSCDEVEEQYNTILKTLNDKNEKRSILLSAKLIELHTELDSQLRALNGIDEDAYKNILIHAINMVSQILYQQDKIYISDSGRHTFTRDALNEKTNLLTQNNIEKLSYLDRLSTKLTPVDKWKAQKIGTCIINQYADRMYDELQSTPAKVAKSAAFALAPLIGGVVGAALGFALGLGIISLSVIAGNTLGLDVAINHGTPLITACSIEIVGTLLGVFGGYKATKHAFFGTGVQGAITNLTDAALGWKDQRVKDNEPNNEIDDYKLLPSCLRPSHSYEVIED